MALPIYSSIDPPGVDRTHQNIVHDPQQRIVLVLPSSVPAQRWAYTLRDRQIDLFSLSVTSAYISVICN